MSVWSAWRGLRFVVVTLSLGGAACGQDSVGSGADAGPLQPKPWDGDLAVGDAVGDSGERPFDILTVIPADSCLSPTATCWSGDCAAGSVSGVNCVAGAVLDEGGHPLGGGVAFVCFDGNCLRPAVDDQGFFSQSVDEGTREVALYWGGFPTPRLTPYCRYDSLCRGAFLSCEPYVLYPAPLSGTAVPETEMEALTQETTVEAEDTGRLVVAAGDALLRPLIAEAWVALTRYPLDQDQPCFIDPARPPLALYAVTPSDSFVLEPGSSYADLKLRQAGLDLPNESGLAPGATVDVYVLGGPHAAEVDLAEGEWRAVTTATVSPDGTRIQTAAGEGLSYLTWFAIYAR